MNKLLPRSFQEANLPILFQELKPQQCLVDVLFDEVKLTQLCVAVEGIFWDTQQMPQMNQLNPKS